MKIYSWTTDFAGEEQGRDSTELDEEVRDVNHALYILIRNLVDYAGIEFAAEAVIQFVNTKKIDKLDLGHGLFWNVELR